MTPNFMAFTMITDGIERHEARAAERRLSRRERALARAAVAPAAAARPARVRPAFRLRIFQGTRHAH